MSAVCAAAILLMLPNFINAETLAQYKKNVNQVKKEFVSLMMPVEDVSDEETDKIREDVFAGAMKLLPAEQRIESAGTTFEVSNKWIIEKIEEYKLNEKTAEDKQLILTSVYERLEAIELKLDEFEKPVNAENSKDAEKRKLNEILSREEFEKAKPEDESLLQKIWYWFVEWIKKFFQKQDSKPLPMSNFGSIAYFMQILLIALVVAVIGFLIYKFAPFLIKRLREREKKEKTKEKIILGEKLAADATPENLLSEAEKLAREGHLREAIRKGYISLLFELSERKLIGLAKHKTNRDYLRSVRTKLELYKNMNGLTQNYERHWYGFEDADETDWEDFKIDYKKVLSKD